MFCNVMSVRGSQFKSYNNSIELVGRAEYWTVENWSRLVTPRIFTVESGDQFSLVSSSPDTALLPSWLSSWCLLWSLASCDNIKCSGCFILHHLLSSPPSNLINNNKCGVALYARPGNWGTEELQLKGSICNKSGPGWSGDEETVGPSSTWAHLDRCRVGALDN